MHKNTVLLLILTVCLNLLFVGIPSSASAANTPERLDVPNFVQHWQPWKDQTYAFGNRTIEYAGCALTSLSMLLKYYGVDTDPEELNNWLKNNNGYLNGENIVWSKATERGNGTIQYLGTVDYPDKADLARINSELDNGFPVIAKMNYKSTSHYVLICGYSGSTYYINDPWTEDPSKTINEGYDPNNDAASSIKGIVLFSSTNPVPPKVPVTSVRSIFEKPVYNNYLPVMTTPKIVLAIGDPFMSVDGKKEEIDPGRGTAPVIVKDKTFLPIRAVIEKMGGKVEYSEADKKITINIKERTLEIWVSKRTAYINGFHFVLDVPPASINSRSMIPLRQIIETLGCKIDWDAPTKQVTISNKS